MKSKILLLSLLCTTGCAHFASRTLEETPTLVGTNVVIVSKTSHMYVTTFFDAKSSLTKAANSPSITSTNQYSAGTRLGGLNQESSGSNAVDIVNSAIGAAVTAAIKSAK